MVAKSFPTNQVCTKNVHKIFWSKIFYGCKIVSSKIGSYQKFSSTIFWSKFFYSCKIIPSKQICDKTILRKIFSRNFFIVEKSSPRKEVGRQKCLRKIFLFFMVGKSFPRKQVERHKFWELFLSKMLYGCKAISSTYLLENILRIFFCRKILWLQNHSPKIMYAEKILRNIFWWKIFIFANSFHHKHVCRKNI